MTTAADLAAMEAARAQHKRLAAHHRRQAARLARDLATRRAQLAAMGVLLVQDHPPTGEAQEARHGRGHTEGP